MNSDDKMVIMKPIEPYRSIFIQSKL